MSNIKFLMVTLAWVLIPVLLIHTVLRIRFQPSEHVVSGIAYNVENDVWISGATKFSIRASVDTYVSEENKSSYCVPKGSPYIELINEAAQDKSIILIIRSAKVSPTLAEGVTTCYPNVTVERQAQND